MTRSSDRRNAALLVGIVLLAAGGFAGLSFGTTGREVRATAQPTPLLLQSVEIAREAAAPCDDMPDPLTAPPVLSEREPVRTPGSAVTSSPTSMST